MATIVEAYRRQNLALRATTTRDLLRLWRILDPERIEATYPDFATAARTLVERDRARAAGLASSYLKAARLESGVGGSPVIRLASGIPAGQVEASLSATARSGLYTALRTGRTAEQASQVAFVRTAGATSRLVLNGGRDTVRQSLRLDPKGRGWIRVPSSAACKFCTMLASRGAVYSAETADFASHDHCACTVSPVYSDRAVPVREYEPTARLRTQEQRDANNARIRGFLADT